MRNRIAWAMVLLCVCTLLGVLFRSEPLATTYTYITSELSQTITGLKTFTGGLTVSSGVTTINGGLTVGGATFAYGTGSVTTTASSITIPTSSLADNLSGIRVKSLPTNSDTIYLSLTGTATSSEMPLGPGDSVDLPCDSASISAISASGTQTLGITAFYN